MLNALQNCVCECSKHIICNEKEKSLMFYYSCPSSQSLKLPLGVFKLYRQYPFKEGQYIIIYIKLKIKLKKKKFKRKKMEKY